MASMDFMNMNMNTGFFSWIISSIRGCIRALENLREYIWPNFHGYPWGALSLPGGAWPKGTR